MEKLEIIKNRIEKPLADLNIVVDSIEYVKEGNTFSLNIVLDRVNGIDMETIVNATNLINPIIDELDLFEESYILDISSKERGINDEQ